MALLAIAADKGSPGVTTTATALAAVWPRPVLLAETDPSGGDLVYRGTAAHGGPLDPNTGLLSLAASARRGLAPQQLWQHSQRLAGGLDVLVGLAVAEQSAALAGLWPTLGRAFRHLSESNLAGSDPAGSGGAAANGTGTAAAAGCDVLADCGRLGPDSPALDLLPDASLILLVARTEPEHLARVRDRAFALSQRLGNGPPVGVLLVVDPKHSQRLTGQVNSLLAPAGARVMGVLAEDPSGAEQLAGRRRGALGKSLLIRSARQTAADLHQRYGAAWAGGTAQSGPGVGR